MKCECELLDIFENQTNNGVNYSFLLCFHIYPKQDSALEDKNSYYEYSRSSLSGLFAINFNETKSRSRRHQKWSLPFFPASASTFLSFTDHLLSFPGYEMCVIESTLKIFQMDPTLSTVDTYRWIEITSEFQLYSLLMPLSIYLLRRRQKKKIVINSHRGIDHHFSQFNAWIK